MLVTNILERRLIFLFMDGLAKPLRGWIKALSPPTIQEEIKKASDMESSTSKGKFQSKGFSSKKEKEKIYSKGIQLVKKHASKIRY